MNPHREPADPAAGFQRSGYHLKAGVLARAFADFVRGRRRDLAADAAVLLAPPTPAPRMLGQANVPPTGAFLLAINHYARPGLDAWWAALLATWAVAQVRPGKALRWLMVSEWAWPAWQYRYVITPMTRRIFAAAAHTYGIFLTPPVLNADYAPAEGARAVRAFLAAARSAAARGDALAIAPEGREGPLGALTTLPPGTGRFLLLLSRSGLPVVPAGVYEDPPGSLVIRFGPAVALTPQSGLEKQELDDRVAREVMGGVAALLPASLRGPYAALEPEA